jgi:glycosyltransferase involved in cell wall biosynthesis
MRILFYTYPVAFGCPGGGEVQLTECRNALQRAGHEVLLYNQWEPQFDVDVVHSFSVQASTMHFCDYVKGRNLPLAISPIIWLGKDIHNYAMTEMGHLFYIADALLPNSRAEAERINAHFGTSMEKMHPVVNGVDARFFELADPGLFREEYANIVGESPFLLYVGNIEHRKNQLQLIRAAKGMDAPVLLFGRIRDETYWQQCEKELPSNVHYLGAIEFASDLQRSAYAACSAFVLPSRLETPGLAALEAAACGAPLCITQEGCTREYFGEHAVYVDPDDVQSIHAGMASVLSRRRSGALRQHILDNYTWDISAAQLVAAYFKIR